MEYQNILKYLQIANKPIEFPITIVEKCKDFSKELSGVYVYFDNEDIENIKDYEDENQSKVSHPDK